MLFVELFLIRWTQAYVVYLSYFTNFVLLASFLGIGLGFLRAGRARDLSGKTPLALAALVGFVVVFPVSIVHPSSGKTLGGLFGAPALPGWIELPVLFLGVVLAMALLAEGVARTFVLLPPLEAYRADIAGSILGVVAFTALSALGVRPVVLGTVMALGFLALFARERWERIAAGGLVALLAIGSAVPSDLWSPYYRVTVRDPSEVGSIAVRVNGRPHQTMLPLSELPALQPFYLYPYDRLAREAPGDVLIVGAGTGNDVAVALSRGADHVVAVEIDPLLQEIGAERHPDSPYADPRVEVHVTDGRAFLERDDRTFDLVLFALPDSLTLVSGQGSLRLESYLFTREATQAVREHLTPAGVFSMYNYYRPDVLDRFAGTVEEVFGTAPCFDLGETLEPRTQAVITAGATQSSVRCATTWRPSETPVPEPAIDDHPFPYLRGGGLPSFYWVSLGLMLAAAVVLVRRQAGRLGDLRGYLDLFFMGAAFLLLETKSVVGFALLFGTTWVVNSLVFAGILLAVLGAIEVARRARLPRPQVLYAMLLAAVAIAYLAPSHTLLALDVVPRFATATALAFAPIFLANLVFAQRFRDTASSASAFGANLLGAMVGGTLEYAAVVTGYRALLVVVAAVYGLAFLAGRRHLSAAV
jgi:SAM-dependent methyltransferase